MSTLHRDINHPWHVAINKYSFEKRHESWMYEAKSAAYELPRLTLLFKMEREGTLPKIHQQCSLSASEPVPDNRLTCCLGIECRKCEFLLAMDKAEVKPEEIDHIKAWTCLGHILQRVGSEFVDTSEGFILTTSDRMFWDTVYGHLSMTPGEEEV